MARNKAAQAGFTLLEVLVALLLLAAVLAPAYQLLSGGGRAVLAAERRAGALAIAEAQITSLGVERRLAAGRFTGQAEGWRWVVRITPRTDPPFDRAADLGMAAFRVTVSVADGRGPVLDLDTTRLGASE